MKKLVIFLVLILFSCSMCLADTILKGGVSKASDKLFGTWRVYSEIFDTNSASIFKASGLDIWNIYEENDVLVLSNPFSGAKAQIKVTTDTDSNLEFVKEGKYNNKNLMDTVSIQLVGDNFSGTNTLVLETISDIDKTVIKTEYAKYKLTGERIAGQEIK